MLPPPRSPPQDHRDPGTQQPQPSPCHHVPQRYPAFARLSPGVESPRLREGARPACRGAGQGAVIQIIFLSVQKPQLRVPHCYPQCHPQPHQPPTGSCFRPVIRRQKFSSKRKKLTRAGKAPVPGSGEPRWDPLQQNHVLKRSLGRADEGEGESHGRVLGL